MYMIHSVYCAHLYAVVKNGECSEALTALYPVL